MSNIEVGKTYAIQHSRKGRFTGKVLSVGNTWATIEITRGRAESMVIGNEVGKGEEVMVRLSLADFTELPEAGATPC